MGKNGCILFYTWGLHCWWGHFYHPTMLRENEQQLHFTGLFTLALHIVARKHEWRYHFWNGTGGVWWHLAWELSTLIALAIKSVEKRTRSMCPKTLLGTCCLLYLEQSSWLLDGRPLHLSLSFQPEGNFISLQFFFQGHLSLSILQKFQAKRLL